MNYYFYITFNHDILRSMAGALWGQEVEKEEEEEEVAGWWVVYL
jgi:hypothetical protein